MIGALVILAVVLGSSEPARTSVVVTLWTDGRGSDAKTHAFGIDPATAAPLPGRAPLVLDGRQWIFPVGGGPGLIYVSPLGAPDQEATEATALTIRDGSQLGVTPPDLPADAEGVVGRWLIPPSAEPTIFLPPTFRAHSDQQVVYAWRWRPSGADELWQFDLTSDSAHLLASVPQIGNMHITTDGRLFILAFDPGLDLTDDEAFRDQDSAIVEANYLAAANDYVVELDPQGGQEIARFQPGGAITRIMPTPDGEHLYLFRPDDGDIALVDLSTMQSEQVALPPGGPWPGVVPFGPMVWPNRSLDGRHVYLTGTRFLSGDDEGPMRFPALGLRIVNLESGQVVYQDSDTSQIYPSPDGRWLAAVLSERQIDGTVRGSGLKLIDADTFQLVAHLEGDTPFSQVAISADSRYAYAVADARTLPSPPDDCSLSCNVITVVDLETLEVIAHHSYEGDVSSIQAFH